MEGAAATQVQLCFALDFTSTSLGRAGSNSSVCDDRQLHSLLAHRTHAQTSWICLAHVNKPTTVVQPEVQAQLASIGGLVNCCCTPTLSASDSAQSPRDAAASINSVNNICLLQPTAGQAVAAKS